MLALKPPVEFTIAENPVSDGFAAEWALAPDGATCPQARPLSAASIANAVVA
jgi:hypothetical protein